MVILLLLLFIIIISSTARRAAGDIGFAFVAGAVGGSALQFLYSASNVS
jgi:hypothetical protein